MLSKTLIVCLLAFLCLNVAIAERLNTRISGQFSATAGQFPYIAFLSYNYNNPSGQLVSQQFTGIIYSATSVITTANNFNNFVNGATLTISVGAFDINSPIQTVQFAATKNTYTVPPAGTTPGPAPADLILVPSQFVAGQSSFDIAVVRLAAPNTFNLAHPEIAIANFPTSSPIPSENFFVVAYGNQAPNSGTFPVLKFAELNIKRADRCQAELSAAGVTLYNRNQHFCIQSRNILDTVVYEGVCLLDQGGAVVRSGNPTDPNEYYEVIGLITYSGDATTCSSSARVPAIVIYLTYFQAGFFDPVLGTLVAAGNGQDPSRNENSENGNFICGNGIVEPNTREKCDPADPATQPCCNANYCNFRATSKLCADGPVQRCMTRDRCYQGNCAQTPKNEGSQCDDEIAGGKCVAGVCTLA